MKRAAALFVLLVVAIAARSAEAYPTMIRHGYAACGACHVDPSGAGALTLYGRAQSDLLVSWHFDPAAVAESGEPSSLTGFALGFVPMPEWFDVSGNLRGGGIVIHGLGEATQLRPLAMASDVNATLSFEYFVAHASLGYGLRAVGPAAIVSQDAGPNNALVSRQHWIGAKLFDAALVVRAGRIPLPFGLRNLEHTSFVRDATRTDVDVDQQHGLAVSFASDLVRAEVMGIAGNFQIHPDVFRERGYAGYVEIAPAGNVALGASSLLTHAQLDVDTSLPLVRHAHGVFARWSPDPRAVLLLEADSLLRHSLAKTTSTSLGGAAWLQLDVEPWQGIHVAPALEGIAWTDGVTPGGAGAWLTLSWYPITHVELRADGIYRQSLPIAGTPSGSLLGLLQVHLFL